MKKLIIVAALLVAVLIFPACNTASRRTAYNSIATVEQSATLAVDDYYTLVLQGKVSTNGVPAISHAYNNLQAAANLAATASQAGTNALASSALVLEASQLGVLINTFKTSK